MRFRLRQFAVAILFAGALLSHQTAAQTTTGDKNRIEQAQSVLKEATSHALQLTSGDGDSFLADIGLLNIKTGRLEEAEKLLAFITSPFQRQRLQRAIGIEYASQGRFSAALRLAETADCGRQIVMDCASRSIQGAVITAHARQGRWQESGNLARLYGFSQPYAYFVLALELTAKGDFASARALQQKIPLQFDRQQIDRAIALAQASSANFNGALASAANLDPYVTQQIAEQMVSAYIRKKDWVKAHQALPLIRPNSRYRQLIEIGIAEGRAGLKKQAAHTIGEAAAELRKLSAEHESKQGRLDWLAEAWGSLVAAELSAGLQSSALAEAEGFYQRTDQWQVWCPIGAAYARMGDFGAAHVIEERAGGLWCVFTVVAQEQARRGNVEGAIATIMSGSVAHQRHSNLSRLIDDLASAGFFQAARQICEHLALYEASLPPVKIQVSPPSHSDEVEKEETEEEKDKRETEEKLNVRYYAHSARLVTRAWAFRKDVTSALSWARTQQSPEAISLALIGVAEGLLGFDDNRISNQR